MDKWHLVLAGVVIVLITWYAAKKWPNALSAVPVIGS